MNFINTTPPVYPIHLYRGDTYERIIRLRSVETLEYLDLTGSIAKAEIRSYEFAPSPVAVFTCQVLNQQLPEELGSILLRLSPEDTSTILPKIVGQLGWWDMNVKLGDNVRTYIRGPVVIEGEFTHD